MVAEVNSHNMPVYLTHTYKSTLPELLQSGFSVNLLFKNIFTQYGNIY